MRGDQVITFDVLGSRAAYAKAWRKLARGALAESENGPECANPARVVASFLAEVRSGALDRVKAPGAGETVSLRTKSGVVCALESDGALYHVFGTGS
jgi:hypothetical protein